MYSSPHFFIFWSPTCSLVFVSDVFVQSVRVLMLTLSAKRNEIFIVLNQIPDPTSFPGPHLAFATQCIYIPFTGHTT